MFPGQIEYMNHIKWKFAAVDVGIIGSSLASLVDNLAWGTLVSGELRVGILSLSVVYEYPQMLKMTDAGRPTLAQTNRTTTC